TASGIAPRSAATTAGSQAASASRPPAESLSTPGRPAIRGRSSPGARCAWTHDPPTEKETTPIPLPADRLRGEFPALETGIHLLSHSLGPVPRGARQALETYVDLWERQVREDVWVEHWWDLSGEVGDLIARVLGGKPGTVQVQPNTSVALSTVISCLDLGAGRR